MVNKRRARDRICLVCEKNFEGAQHCGVEVCRACAAFYRRAVQQKKTFVCRKGGNKCSLQTGRKECCQKCRFTKCILVGLALFEKMADETQVLSCSVVLHNEAHQVTASTSMPSMRRFVYYFKEATSECVHRENQLRSIKGFNKTMKFKDIIYPLPHDHMPELFEVSKEVVRPFITKVFPVFGSFTSNQQDIFLIYAMVAIWDLESGYRTMKVFNDPKSRKLMCGGTMYLDIDRLEEHFELDELELDGKLGKMDQNMSMDYLRMMVVALLSSTHSILHRIKLTDVEYIAAVALVLWDGTSCIDEVAESIAAKERSNIYNELFYYYRDVLKIDNYIDRIMQMKELGRHIQGNVVKMRNHVNCLKVFNYFEGNNEMFEALQRLPVH